MSNKPSNSKRSSQRLQNRVYLSKVTKIKKIKMQKIQHLPLPFLTSTQIWVPGSENCTINRLFPAPVEFIQFHTSRHKSPNESHGVGLAGDTSMTPFLIGVTVAVWGVCSSGFSMATECWQRVTNDNSRQKSQIRFTPFFLHDYSVVHNLFLFFSFTVKYSHLSLRNLSSLVFRFSLLEKRSHWKKRKFHIA